MFPRKTQCFMNARLWVLSDGFGETLFFETDFLKKTHFEKEYFWKVDATVHAPDSLWMRCMVCSRCAWVWWWIGYMALICYMNVAKAVFHYEKW